MLIRSTLTDALRCRVVSRYVRAGEAARLLGVQKATLYAYVSRGLVSRTVAIDGRTSLYALDDIEVARRPDAAPRVRAAAVARRADRHRRDDARRVRAALPRPRRRRAGQDVLVRAGRRAAVDRHAAGRRRVAGGRARRRRPGRRRHQGRRRRQRRAGDGRHGERARRPSPGRRPAGGGAASARRRDDRARRIRRRAVAWRRASPRAGGHPARWRRRSIGRSCCSPTTSWRRARWPCASPARRGLVRTRRSPPGWRRCRARCTAARRKEVHALLVECEEIGAAAAVGRRLQARERLPGFGHKIYQGEDPRLAPLLEAVALLPDPAGRRDVVDDLLAETSDRIMRRPNVDLGVGALSLRRRACRRTSRCSPSPASPASPPTSTRSSRSARCATAASPARRARDIWAGSSPIPGLGVISDGIRRRSRPVSVTAGGFPFPVPCDTHGGRGGSDGLAGLPP